MSLILNSKKPSFPLINKPLCSFRTSKAYLWGLIRHELSSLPQAHDHRPNVLDAACHTLITRSMFPPSFKYYGLDISEQRLVAASSNRLKHDVLLLADLVKPIPLSSCFEVVVSCNTMSHLSFEQQKAALKNLISLCADEGHLYINLSVSIDNMIHISKLLVNFEYVYPVYFDSYISSRLESQKGHLNISNIFDYLPSSEFNVPNDASLHRQVLLICKNRVPKNLPPSVLPSLSPTEQWITLNTTPSCTISSFIDDHSFLDQYDFSNTMVLFSPFLYHSIHSKSLIQSLLDQNIPVSPLKENITPPSNVSKLLFLGLENEWIGNVHDVRILVNQFRDISSISSVFVYIKSRNNAISSPSLLFQDF